MDTWEILNSVYAPLYRRVQELGKLLAAAGYTARWGWYNFHSTLRNGEYRVELFPVPVITVDQKCDILMELDCICVDAHLTCEQAKNFDWGSVPWMFEIYGVENYTEDLYRPGMPLRELSARIERYGKDVGIAVPLSTDCEDREILKIVEACHKWDTHIK